MTVPGLSGRNIIDSLQHGDPRGSTWRPAEADTSIRPGWFYHAAEDGRVRSVETLMNLYFQSVGRNSKLLLNVPPTKDGLLHATDVERLTGFGDRRRAAFAEDLAAGRKMRWQRTGATTARGEIDLGRARSFTVTRLEEQIENGQTVARYSLHGAGEDGEFKILSRGTTVGHARLDRITAVNIRRVRVEIEDAIAPPDPVRLKLFA